MRRLPVAIGFALVATAALGVEASAQTATATATFEVQAIREVSVSGNPAALIIDAGSELAGVTDNSTTWSVTTNETGTKVTGAINTAMPSGVTLKVSLGAPTGATSAAATALSTTAADLVTGISKVQGSGLAVTYTLSATPAAGVVASTTKTVTFTITTGI